MSCIPRCAQCDAPMDPYGRDGGHAWCGVCLAEDDARIARENTERLKAAVQKRAA